MASLRDVREKIEHWQSAKGIEIAAVVIEPIQSAGGDHHITSFYANELRRLTKEMGVYMIIDEVHTGIACSGRFWAHEYWNLYSPPDFVSFSKKAQASGFYYPEEFRAKFAFRHFNTWMGDPVRAAMMAKQNEIIYDQNLMENAIEVGAYFQDELTKVAQESPEWVTNVRGRGLCLAFDVDFHAGTDTQRAKLVKELKHRGVNVPYCGLNTIRARPCLYFTRKHTDIYVKVLRESIAHLNKTQ